MQLIGVIISTMLLINPVHSNTNSNHEHPIIQIDLHEKELTFNKRKETINFPISIGTELSPTPVGQFTVIEKSRAWGGGFGSRWLGLNVSWGTYGIHGTNRPHLIGGNVSSGCIRMHNEDVEKLYEMVPVGTTVVIKGVITGAGKGEFKNLSKGSKGNLVQLVQNRLSAMGLYDGNMDGIFGNDTEAALRAFQRQQNISVNGVVSYREYLLLGLLE